MPSMESAAEHFGALAGLRDAGLIRHLGISGAEPGHLAEAQAIAPVVCVQNRYGIGASPKAHEFLDACGAQGVAFVPYFAIAGDGREAGHTGTEDDEVLAVARAHEVRPRRSGWRGRCSGGRTCWPSPGPAIPITWPPTWPPARCGSPRPK